MDYNSKGGDIMKFPETANRIRHILDLRGMTAQQLADRSGVGKSSISHYVNGSNEPHNQNAGKMAAILHCDPQWLMGFDVPMEKSEEHYDFIVKGNGDMMDLIIESNEKGRNMQHLFEYLKRLNADGIKKLQERAEELVEVPKYKKDGDG